MQLVCKLLNVLNVRYFSRGVVHIAGEHKCNGHATVILFTANFINYCSLTNDYKWRRFENKAYFTCKDIQNKVIIYEYIFASNICHDFLLPFHHYN